MKRRPMRQRRDHGVEALPLLLDAVLGQMHAEEIGEHARAQVGDARRYVLRLEELVSQRVVLRVVGFDRFVHAKAA